MNQKVMVTKEELFRILGPASMSFAMFMANGTQLGSAVKILFENSIDFDLNDPLVQESLIPLLVANGALTESDVARVNAYVANYIQGFNLI